MRITRTLTAVSAVALILVVVALGLRSGTTLGAGTPAAKAGATAAVAHPAHIHKGTCATLGDVVYPLADLTPPTNAGTPTAKGTPAAGTGGVESRSTTTVKAKLADLVSKGPYAINVHESKAQIQHYIACGNITGTAKSGTLTVGLKELNASGVAGEAVLKDNGDGTTTVTVTLTKATATGAKATPTA